MTFRKTVSHRFHTCFHLIHTLSDYKIPFGTISKGRYYIFLTLFHIRKLYSEMF